jgi:cell division protein FtsI (penicillin-binding protein 3)
MARSGQSKSEDVKPLRGSKVLQRESSTKRQMDSCKHRLIFLGMGFCICFMLLALRLVDVAVIEAYGKAEEEQTATLPGKPHTRAQIVDRNGLMLAGSLKTRSLYANPKLVQRFNTEKVARELVKAMPDLNYFQVLALLKSDKKFAYIKRHLTPAEQDAVNRIGVPGLDFEESERRIYPYQNLYAHVLGYVDVDNQGIAGVEKHFNALLAQGDKPLQLSVDTRVQNIVREEILAGMKEFRAIGGIGVVMDAKNGELISMVSLPDFDSNHPGTASKDARFNRATLGVYEMGSTFKAFTTAMALDYGTARMNSGYDATNPIRFARWTISDTHPKKRWLSVPEIFVYSSNIGTVRMILEVGKERQQRFLKSLGLFEKVDLELPELASPLIPNPWNDINMLTVSYGHGISVTPMHLVQSIATLVGTGHKVSPTLVLGGKGEASQGEPLVKPEVVQQMRQLMRMVVQYGTGSKANVEGYRVGGKTGTAEKVKGRGYNMNDKLASFAGVFPADDPRYVVLVVMDEPRGNKSTFGYATGGWVSAPVAKKIISRMATLYAIKPVYDLPTEPGELPTYQKPATNRYIHAASYAVGR